MTKQPEKPQKRGFPFSFLDSSDLEKNPFLKQNKDLYSEYIGYPLDELICLPSNEMNGALFFKERIPAITKAIYKKFLSRNDAKFCIKNSEIILFVYTLTKIDEVILFFVWQIRTQISTETRSSWEERCGLGRGDCCRKNYISWVKQLPLNQTFDSCLVILQRQPGWLESFIEKNCQYKKQHVNCLPFVFSHFFNCENKQAREKYKMLFNGLSIASDFTFNSDPDQVSFCYGGVERRDEPLCISLYDSICLDTTQENSVEHNFQNFLSDSLTTCFNYQENRVDSFSGKPKEHRLLYLTVVI